LAEPFGELHQLPREGDLLVITQTVLEQAGDDLAHAQADGAKKHQQLAIFLNHRSTVPRARWTAGPATGSGEASIAGPASSGEYLGGAVYLSGPCHTGRS
jgi:hypothetical protein